jgi:hypothetical protein
MKAALLVLALVMGMVGPLSAQDGEPSVAIVSPSAESYLSGSVQLAARIEPAPSLADVMQVLFYVDGRLVCTLMDPRVPECTWDAGADVAEHVVRVVVEMKGGGRLVSSTRTKKLDHAETVNVDVVQLTAVVSDRHRFVSGLNQSAFRLKEDGVPQRIAHFSSEGSPLELVVAIDVSGSMTESMPQLKNAVRRFLSALGPKDQVTLAAFNDNMFTLTRRETSVAQRTRAVDRLSAWGGTALYDVIIRGVQQLARQPAAACSWSSATVTIARATPPSTPSSRRCAPTTPRCSWWRSAAASRKRS